MDQFKIIAGNGREYGPVPPETIGQWIEEGRASGKTQVQREGESEWRPLREVPELAELLESESPPQPVPSTEAAPLPANVESRNHDVWAAGCLGRGFSLYQSRFGLATAMAAILIGVVLGVGIVSLVAEAVLVKVPGLGIVLATLLQLAINLAMAPLYVGPVYFFIKAARGQPGGLGDLFGGYQRAPITCMVGALVQWVILVLVMVPGFIVLEASCRPVLEYLVAIGAYLDAGGKGPVPPVPTLDSGNVVGFFAGAAMICVPLVYLSTCWMFSLPLVVDRQIGFWRAMGISRRVVSRHWFMVFFFVTLGSVIFTAGLLLCGIGVLFTGPIFAAMVAMAYVHLFDARPGEENADEP